MISFLKGKICNKDNGFIIVDVNGVGYQVNVPSISKFILNDSEQLVFTYLYVREDRLVLYGFSTETDRNFFKVLIEAPGVGPKMALNILSNMGAENFHNAVLEEDLNLISSISGIGKKMAKKIVLELKEKFKKSSFDGDIISSELNPKDFINDAIEALKTLGYQEKEAKKRVVNAYQKNKNSNSTSLENLIKNALNKDKND
ncbi:MAG: Holliday junction branch migration protein RuvA [Atribacterota bacterium]|jgi:Holliday junction DNA helicase RuvA|nr:Holliday junction branch migration protein RuvA [Atribacterota bacterium]MDD4765741.1 Holliday junction branch migration protein RuvA [Atribacterota bacterium]